MLVQNLKGFRDFLTKEAKKRQYLISKLKNVFELYGFEPLETPALEYDEILTGKYGEEGEKLMYRFVDNGKRKVAMRYDQTVPTARVVAQYGDKLPMPFKRYQIQPVWRAENTQKGRYREFIQCDVDTIGTSSPLADAEIIALTVTSYKKLGFERIKILINDRSLFEGLSNRAVTVIDKLKKIGQDGVCKELVDKKIVTTANEAKKLLSSLLEKKPTQRLKDIFFLLDKLEVSKEHIEFSPALARGLAYYTGMIFEAESSEYPGGSLAGGGRYDNLIGIFAGKKIPAVGLAFGFDRTFEAMENLGLFPENLIQSPAKILVTIFNKELEVKSLEVFMQLQSNNIASEIYLENNVKMEKQLKYADMKKIPYAIIIGPNEATENKITLKNLETKEQQSYSMLDLISVLGE